VVHDESCEYRVVRLTLALALFLLLAAPARAQQDDCPGFLPQIACEAPQDPAAIEAYEGSWLHRTLAFQFRLGNTLPLVNAPYLGTHNSANSTSEDPTLSGSDANQMLSLTDQLRLDVRSLELDVHNIGGTPVLCHGRGADQMHAGCTNERTFAQRLPELRAWLDAHPRQVVLLYLEDHLEGAYDSGAAVLENVLGPHLYRPPPGACTPMPLQLTRKQVLAAGKQVLAISSCGEGTAWRGLVFDDAERAKHEGSASDFEAYPACRYSGHFQRFFEDSTALSFGVGGGQASPGLTPDVTREMTRCGADLLGFDQLLPGDGRLAASAWSWARNQPSGPGCAVQSGRWRIVPCARKRAFACGNAGRGFRIVKRRGPWRARPAGCRRALPRTGFEAQRLRDAMKAAGVRSVWLRYRS